MAEIESREDGITVSMKRQEAAALAALTEIGLDADEAQGRILSPATAERALQELRASRGSVALKRPEASTLVAIAQRTLQLVNSPRGLFAPLFEGVELDAARRGLDQLTGAMR